MRKQFNTTTAGLSTAHAALHYGVVTAKYPGAWLEWDGLTPINEFLLALHDRPSEHVKDASGRTSGRWQSPGLDALHAIPFLYRNASQYLLARHALNAMGLADPVDAVAVARDMHERLDTMRSVFAAYNWNRLDGDFAEATTMIEVADSKPWQDVGDVVADSTVESARMFVSCSLEESLETFIEELAAQGERMTNAQFTLVDVAARELIEEHDLDGWLEVVLDTLQDGPAGTAKEQRTKLKTGLQAQGTKRFFATNKLYRLLIKARRQLASTLNQLRRDQERVTAYTQRPSSEQYAGSDEGMQVQLGRIDHWLAGDDTTGLDGYDPGTRFAEAIKLGESELEDLNELIDALEAEQRMLTPVWRVINRRGAPYWYADQNTFFTIDEKDKAEAHREKLRDEWIASRPMELKRGLDKKALELLAELANFNE